MKAWRYPFVIVMMPLECLRKSAWSEEEQKVEFWCQIIADCTGSQVIVPAGSEFGAKGAALLAAVGIHWFENISEAAKLTVSIIHTYQPNPDLKPVYDTVYTTYRQLRNDLPPSWQLSSETRSL